MKGDLVCVVCVRESVEHGKGVLHIWVLEVCESLAIWIMGRTGCCATFIRLQKLQMIHTSILVTL